LAQDPDDGAASKGEVLSGSGENVVEPVPPTVGPPPGESIAGASRLPASEVRPVDLDNLVTPDGQKLPNPATLKLQQLAFVNSLTGDQRAQIRAILDARPAHMDSVKATLGNPLETGAAAKLAPEQIESIDQANRQWADGINASIKSVLTPEQAQAFDSSLLPHPDVWSAKLGVELSEVTPQTSGDCYNAFYYGYNYTHPYAYYQYLYSYYAYLYESDPYNLEVYYLGSDAYYYSYLAYLYSYYAYYYYYDSTYSFSSLYFNGHTEGFTYYGYLMAYLSYTWTGGDYAYDAYLYGYYAYLYSDMCYDLGTDCYFN
jgi:hypothetical protein